MRIRPPVCTKGRRLAVSRRADRRGVSLNLFRRFRHRHYSRQSARLHRLRPYRRRFPATWRLGGHIACGQLTNAADAGYNELSQKNGNGRDAHERSSPLLKTERIRFGRSWRKAKICRRRFPPRPWRWKHVLACDLAQDEQDDFARQRQQQVVMALAKRLPPGLRPRRPPRRRLPRRRHACRPPARSAPGRSARAQPRRQALGQRHDDLLPLAGEIVLFILRQIAGNLFQRHGRGGNRLRHVFACPPAAPEAYPFGFQKRRLRSCASPVSF